MDEFVDTSDTRNIQWWQNLFSRTWFLFQNFEKNQMRSDRRRSSDIYDKWQTETNRHELHTSKNNIYFLDPLLITSQVLLFWLIHQEWIRQLQIIRIHLRHFIPCLLLTMSIRSKLLNEVVDEMHSVISNNNFIKVHIPFYSNQINYQLFSLANVSITSAAMDQMMPDFQSMSLKP